MTREYIKWFSHQVNREMEILVFGHAGQPVLFFPTRTARFYDYENWRIIEALRPRIEAGELQVYCVDSYDHESFYSYLHPADKMRKHGDYERYIIDQVLPYIRTRNSNDNLMVAGCSLGGYHAVNIAMRHPQYFKKVVGMSARYDLTLSSDRFPDLLNGYFDDNIYFNMPSRFMPHLQDKTILEQQRNLDITLVVGREDPFLPNNEYFTETLWSKELKPDFFVWNEEAHRAYYWRRMVQLYF